MRKYEECFVHPNQAPYTQSTKKRGNPTKTNYTSKMKVNKSGEWNTENNWTKFEREPDTRNE